MYTDHVDSKIDQLIALSPQSIYIYSVASQQIVLLLRYNLALSMHDLRLKRLAWFATFPALVLQEVSHRLVEVAADSVTRYGVILVRIYLINKCRVISANMNTSQDKYDLRYLLLTIAPRCQNFSPDCENQLLLRSEHSLKLPNVESEHCL